MLPPIDTIIENFEIVEDDDMRLEYLIELGRALPPMPESERTEANRVHGCESQVWIDTRAERADGTPRLVLHGFSDSFIVRGFVALMIALYTGKTPGGRRDRRPRPVPTAPLRRPRHVEALQRRAGDGGAHPPRRGPARRRGLSGPGGLTPPEAQAARSGPVASRSRP